MLVKRKITTAIASVALAASGVLIAGAAPAAAATSCQTWFDEKTHGGVCYGTKAKYRVHAECFDGVIKDSPWVTAGNWTYSYCSGHDGWKTAVIKFKL
jgi:hypothetical protein